MNKYSSVLFLSLLTLTACGSKVVVEPPSKVLEIQKYNTVLQGGKNPTHGSQVAFMYGAVEGVGETKANGVAYLPTFEDGVSELTVNVNILPAPEGNHYLVMLSNGTPTGLIEVGKLESIVGDVRHTVKLTTKADLKAYSSLLIYLQDDKGAASQGLVAQGTLKKTK